MDGEEEEEINQESDQLIPKNAQYKTYSRRWYILALFAMFGLLQNTVWNTFGPVLNSTRKAFGWTLGDIALIPNIGNIALLFTVPIGSSFLSKYGLRISSLTAVGFMVVGTVARCVTQHSTILLGLCLLSGVLTGFAGNANSGFISHLSSVWFPTHQRSTATSVVVFANTAGMAASFILGPLIVERNGTYPGGNVHPGSSADELRDNIMMLLYIEAGLCGLVFLLMLVYFPSCPPTPPSASASTARVNFLAGFTALSRNVSFWFVGASFALTATFYSWGNVWNMNLARLGLTEREAGWLGFYTTIAGAVACVLISLLTDRFLRWMKFILQMNLVIASLFITVAALQCLEVLPAHKVVLYGSVIVSGTCIYASTPLMYELGSEVAYPVQEGIVGFTLAFLNCSVAIVFLSLLEIPGIGTQWVLYCVWISFVLSALLIIWVQPTYGRLQVDVTSEFRSDVTSSVNYNTHSEHSPRHGHHMDNEC